MSYTAKRKILFAALGIIVVLAWAPLRDSGASDAVVFGLMLTLMLGGAALAIKLAGKSDDK